MLFSLHLDGVEISDPMYHRVSGTQRVIKPKWVFTWRFPFLVKYQPGYDYMNGEIETIWDDIVFGPYMDRHEINQIGIMVYGFDKPKMTSQIKRTIPRGVTMTVTDWKMVLS